MQLVSSLAFQKLNMLCVILNDELVFFCKTILIYCLCEFAAEVMFLVQSVCLSVCPSDYSQTCERILTKFFGGVGHGSRTK